MWGCPTDDAYDVLLNGSLSQVRKNLYQFLCLAAQYYPDTPLWIDAICINQADDVDKSKQVSRMADVYQGACRTLV